MRNSKTNSFIEVSQITVSKRRPSLDSVQAVIKQAGHSSKQGTFKETVAIWLKWIHLFSGWTLSQWLIFTGSRNQLLLLAKSRQTLNKPCHRTRYDPVTEYTKTTFALKQFSIGLVGEEDNYRTDKRLLEEHREIPAQPRRIRGI